MVTPFDFSSRRMSNTSCTINGDRPIEGRQLLRAGWFPEKCTR
jgi:hypothetical protein